MNHPITIKELAYLCKKEIDAGYGNREIYISSDDEGNSYHGLYFGFTKDKDTIEKASLYCNADFENIENTVILG